ncbi:MAG: imelysin family protein, partial [Balneolaceae bacterium]
MKVINQMRREIFAGLAAILLLLVACSGEESLGPDTDNFDRRAMLVHWADEIIVPSFSAFAEQTASLESAAGEFVDDPSVTTLAGVREAWEEAYIGFQWVSMFEIGPAMEVGGGTGSTFRDFLNLYPTDTAETDDSDDSDIEFVVGEGSWNLELPSMRDHQGFPALDYLLYGLADSDEELLAIYLSGSNADDWKAYLNDLAFRIHQLASTVRDGWTDGYRDQ